MTKRQAIAAARKNGGRFVRTREGCMSLAALAKVAARRLPSGVASWEYTRPDAYDRAGGATGGTLQLFNRRGSLVARISVVKGC